MAKFQVSVSFINAWRERIAGLVVAQLAQGITPEKISLSIALGISLGVFPVLGTTTVLCAIAAVRLKLNQPIIQLVNWLVYPLQLALLLVFVHIGEWITHAPPVNFSVPELIQTFHESPLKFLQEFGVCQLQGLVAWLFIAPIVTAIVFFALIHPLKRLAPKATSDALK
ncbi:MAG TPA: DUF2062 domain-containing protein [Candidatus Sulfotelmatobacter sp.]|nr:DUF2062 domain-containing protein [Candidatus Sulfotelmatobacter sp.]